MSDAAKANEFDLIFEGTARSTGRMRCDVRVDMPAWKEHWDLATDEGAFHGGEATAPPPLALFTAGCKVILLSDQCKKLGTSLTCKIS